MAPIAARSFQAVLERLPSRLNWTIARIPFDISKVWGTRGQLKVRGDINGFPFRTSLFATGDGAHMLLVNKRMQAGGHVRAGAAAKLRLEPDTEERTVDVPPELLRIFSGERALLRWYHTLNYSTRRNVADWIAEVRSPEARARRATQLAERLLATMEAEKELPPAIRTAFAADARAQEGWQRMSPSCRRAHLLAIFYYREPAAQGRRIAQTVREAYEKAGKTAGKAIR